MTNEVCLSITNDRGSYRFSERTFRLTYSNKFGSSKVKIPAPFRSFGS